VELRSLPRRPFVWIVGVVVELARDWIARFIAVQGIDRAMAIGAQAYSALLPLLIVYGSVLPRAGKRSFADTVIDRFDLTGSTAESVRMAFAPAGAVESSVTVLGIVLLVISGLSFTRGMQRLYEGAYGLPTLGMRNSFRGLEWLVVVALAATVRPPLTELFGGGLKVAVALAISVLLWLVTPYLLLGGRLNWRRLLPGAALTAVGMLGVGVWSVIWLPHTLSTSARQYGVIGIGFAMLTYLFAVAVVLVVATTGGAMIADRLARRRGDA
jgi:membrane protein